MKLVKRILKNLIIRPAKLDDYRLYSYSTPAGDFDYQKYKKVQEQGNKKKINCSWVTQKDIIFLSDYIKKHNPRPLFGLCHGTRQGFEQKWFSDQLGCTVLGTEISETAVNFPNTIQWDFHETNPEWKNKADFIYSNSFDHSYDPQKSLTAWLEALQPEGVCIIEHSKYHTPEATSELDPFGARLEIMPYLILTWTKNNASVRQILELTSTNKDQQEIVKHFLVIKKN